VGNKNLQSGVPEGDDPGGAPARDAARRRIRAPAAAAAHLSRTAARRRNSQLFPSDSGRDFAWGRATTSVRRQLGAAAGGIFLDLVFSLTAHWGRVGCLLSLRVGPSSVYWHFDCFEGLSDWQ
jgi:hypothetical protein